MAEPASPDPHDAALALSILTKFAVDSYRMGHFDAEDGTIDCSHVDLTEPERDLMRRLAPGDG